MTETSAPAGAAVDRDEPRTDVERVEALARAHRRILEQVKRRIVGQDDVIELLLIALFARGHGLFVGVPGLAKTLLITTLGEVLSLRSNRIQFTPDLMPSDITGTDVLEVDAETGERRFRFVHGPVFTNILLADEINRTPPKTQAALLQAMAEGRVTAGGRTYPLEPPYLVFATQNPIEQEGTYPLPEAQLDRFLFQIDVTYPSAEEEVEIVQRTTTPVTQPPEPVMSRDQILELQELVPRVPAASHVVEHAVRIARTTRPDDASAPAIVRDYVAFGAGPRASQALVLGAKARAVLDGRYAAEIDDVRALAGPVLRHRLVPSFRGEAEGVRATDVIAATLEAVPA
jgi:MoxR-like ATPase